MSGFGVGVSLLCNIITWGGVMFEVVGGLFQNNILLTTICTLLVAMGLVGVRLVKQRRLRKGAQRQSYTETFMSIE